ncbi:guanylate-binding protein 3-like [Ruditapes philippinarum]|uniref:guanylate-binding protein 3-like n=1 Tax=Ruditapes philippinarum TaxID=129788 RepID=UPI00295BC291|nr:guanylate-binding protein 3-like [Ruditapes philippinarum]
MPCIDDALTIMAIKENEIAVRKAVGMCKKEIESLGIPLPDDFELKYKQIQRDALKQFRKKAVLDDKQVFQKIAEKEMDSFKIQTVKENKIFLQKTCFQELQCMYDILIKPKVDKGTYFEQGGYKTYREDFAGLRKNIKERLPGVNSYIVHMSGLEFENRYREQDEEILEKTNLSELEIKAEIQKQQGMIEQRKGELVQKEDLRKQSEAEKWEDYKDELSSERKKEQKELEEKYASSLEDWEKGKMDLERKIKEKDDVISKLRKSQRRSPTIVAQKPAMKETVLKTFLSLIPVVGPIASGVYERFSSS